MKHVGVHYIAELAKVSIGTVDRALHGRGGISPATRDRVLRIAKQLDYAPHPVAQALSIGRATRRLGICIPREISFFYDQMRDGMFDEAARWRGLGIELVYRPVPALGEKEKEQIEYLLDNGVSALVVTPGNPKLATPLINRAEKKGVRVICTTTDAPRSRRSSVVGLDPGLSGRLAAELMAKFLPPRSQVAVITGMLATEEHRRKAEGFRSAFRKQCPGGVPVAVVEAHESEDESYRKTLALLRDFPELRGLYVSTVNCMPVCEALHQSGLAGNIRLITTDLFLRMVPYLERGTIAASIYQDPYLQGQLAVRLLADYFLHGTAIPPTCYLNPGVVLRTNLRLFRECAQ